jgi:hypothetical protein
MPTKNLNFSFNHLKVWVFISLLVLGGGLLNSWFGFPLPALSEGIFSSIGGVIPYSDSAGYFTGAHRFIENGVLDSWNMRRPLNTLLLAFYLKITNFNFWYVMILQMGVCGIAFSLYLRTLRQDLGTLSTFAALFFVYYYAQMYIQTTLCEILGLTVGLFSFVLLWNGWQERKRFIFNLGMVALAVGLSARAGPNFMVLGFLFLVYLDPFTKSRFKDLSYSLLCFAVPFFLLSKLSSIFGTPGGMAFSNFGLTLYGLVSGGKGWTYAYSDPQIRNLLTGQNEANEALILYRESWNVFKGNPLLLFFGMSKYLVKFMAWFVKQLTIGNGPLKYITGALSIGFWGIISFQILRNREKVNRSFLFLIITFFSIASSSMIIFQDGGMRTFAVAIPFMGALLSLAFVAVPSFKDYRGVQNIGASCGILFIVIASVTAIYLPTFRTTREISNFTINKIPGQETFLTYNVNRQPHILISSSPGMNFRTISPNTIRKLWTLYSVGDEILAKNLLNTVNEYRNDNLVLLQLYDYISHSSKWLIAENHILNLHSDWIEIHASLPSQDNKIIYVANSFKEPT